MSGGSTDCTTETLLSYTPDHTIGWTYRSQKTQLHTGLAKLLPCRGFRWTWPGLGAHPFAVGFARKPDTGS